MAIKLTPKELAMRGITAPTFSREALEYGAQELSRWAGIDISVEDYAKSLKIDLPSISVPSIPTVPGVSSVSTPTFSREALEVGVRDLSKWTGETIPIEKYAEALKVELPPKEEPPRPPIEGYGGFKSIPKTPELATVSFIDAKTGKSYLIPESTAKALKATSAYAEAKGTTEQRLGIAYATTNKEFNAWLAQLQKEQPDLHKVYEKGGYSALGKAITKKEQEYSQIVSKLKDYKSNGSYNLYDALTVGAITENEAKKVFSDEAMKEVLPAAKQWLNLEKDFTALALKKTLAGFPGRESQEWYIKEFNTNAYYTGGAVPNKPYAEMTDNQKSRVLGFYATNRPEYWKERAKATGKVALGFVPIVGTIALWKEMSPTWRAISIAGDILCVSFIIKGAAAGARAARGYTAAARMKAAAKGAGQMTLAETTAFADIAAHPIGTAKGIGRQIQSAIETLAHPKKLPLGATELTYTTIRLPVRDVGGSAKAIKLRDAAVAAAIHGKQGTATIGDIKLTLTPSKLQKVGGALAVHATPDVRPYLNGAVVKGGAEGSGVFLSPNFHSRFAQATAFGDVPTGGMKGALIIRDPKVLKAIAPSGKTYMSTVEIEALLKPGTRLPAPSQILFTRDAAGYKLAFLVIGKPFTPAQIAKLKFLGSMDTIGQIFKPTMKLTGAERTAIEAMDDMIALSRERATLARQLETARTAGRVAQTRTLAQRIADIDGKIAELTRRVNIPRDLIRPMNIVWAEYTDKGILERWREITARQATRTPRGTRLPDIRPAQGLRRATLVREELRKAPYAPYITLAKPPYEPPYVPSYVPTKMPLYAPEKPPSYVPPEVPVLAPPRPPYVPRRVPPSAPSPAPKHPRVKIEPTKLKREKIPREGPALATWKQGMYWVSIFPPFRTKGTKPDVVYSRHKPPWGSVIAKGRHAPRKTLRSIGRVPPMIEVPMGIVTARIRNGRKLTFSRQPRRRKRR